MAPATALQSQDDRLPMTVTEPALFRTLFYALAGNLAIPSK
jgi:hypothetical protein